MRCWIGNSNGKLQENNWKKQKKIVLITYSRGDRRGFLLQVYCFRRRRMMGYLNRVWVATSVAVVQGHTDQGIKLNGARSLAHRLASSSSAAESVVAPAVAVGAGGCGCGRDQPVEDSVRKAMYLSCWNAN